MRFVTNRLWVRMSLAFSAIVILAAVAVALTGRLIVNTGVLRAAWDDNLRRSGGLVEILGQHYLQTGSWDQVAEVFEDDRFTGYSQLVVIYDADQQVVYGEAPEGEPFTPKEEPGDGGPGWNPLPFPLRDGHDGVILGYLDLSAASREAAQIPQPGLDLISSALIQFAVVGGVLAIGFGVFMSRMVTAPLNRLAEAARAIGERRLDQRLTLKGTHEVVTVAGAFNEMAASLQKAEELRRNLVADVAHELRTPLTVLQGNLRAILDDVYPLEKAEIARLYDQTRLLNRLVNDLHELSQAEAGQLPLNVQAVDLAALIEQSVSSYQPVSDEQSVALQTVLEDNLPPIAADAARVRQVMHNLLSNALRHTPAGGRVTVTARSSGAMVEVSVADTGQGIAPEHLPYVFDRFYRTDSARSRDNGGAGLGLAITRAIVESHGGTITVASDATPNHGTTFTLSLPVSPEEPESLAAASPVP